MNKKRYNRQVLVDELIAAGTQVTVDGRIKCPFHDDKKPSGGIYCRGGVWRFKCQTSTCDFDAGDYLDVRAKAQGLPLGDVLKGEESLMPTGVPKPFAPQQTPINKQYLTIADIKASYPRLEAVYEYRNETGNPHLVVVRYLDIHKDKRFAQYKWLNGHYALGAPDSPFQLYRLDEIRKASTVFVVEGEKAADALRSIGKVATTSMGGAEKASRTTWGPLAGKKVILWPDNDEVGRNHFKGGLRKSGVKITGVLEILERLDPAPVVELIDVKRLGMGAKEDAADFVKAGRDIKDALEAAIPVGGAIGVWNMMQDTISGKRRNQVFPWPLLSKYTKALLPGTVTVVCGSPGTGKSFFLLQALAYWFEKGISVAGYEMEESTDIHLTRALAQRMNNASLLNDEWVRKPKNAEFASKAIQDNWKFLSGLRSCLWDTKQNSVTLQDMLEWVGRRAKDGCRIIVIDPITAAAAGNERWSKDEAFMKGCEKIASEYACSVVIATHPKGGVVLTSAGGNLNEVAGGQAYGRLSQTVLWLAALPDNTEVEVKNEFDTTETVKCNMLVHIKKARHGPVEPGLCFANIFSKDTLKFKELGLVSNRIKG